MVHPRIGDDERERAAAHLREHLAAGRITADEFDQRVGAALQARTQPDLDVLFRDLPEPRPATTQLPPLQWVDEPAPVRPTPWWTHWGLFVATILLAGVTRGRLGPLVAFMAVWCFWLGPMVADARHEHDRRRELDR